MRGIEEDEFEAKLSRIGNRRARKAIEYIRGVRLGAEKAGAAADSASNL